MRKKADIMELVQTYLSKEGYAAVACMFDNADDMSMWVRSSGKPPGSLELTIKPFIDAAFANDLNTRQSSQGYVIMLAGGLVALESRSTVNYSTIYCRG